MHSDDNAPSAIPVSLTRRFLDELTTDQLLERLDLALEGANLGIWDWDLRDNSVQFDRRWCEMLGLDHATTPMVLETWSARVHPDDLDGCYRDIQAHLAGTSPRYQNTHRMRHADGSWRHILDRGRISGRDADDRPIRFTGTHLDVTALVVAQQRVRLEERARLAVLGNFAATLAHELNSPLQVIALAAHALDALEVPPAQEGALREAVQAIDEMTRHAGRITSALRVLAADVGADANAGCRIPEVLERTRDLFQARFDGEGIRLDIENATADIMVDAPLGDVLRAMVILFDAALRALLGVSADTRAVRLQVTCDGETVQFHCADTGVPWGAPGEQGTAGADAGLGPVELLQQFVERHGGRIASEGGGRANAYVVRLPRAGRRAE
jgi:PAS domain S-box-containing protein